MHRLTILILGMLLSFQSVFSQVSITGPTCAIIGNSYYYTISGAWGGTTSISWCVSGGTIVGSGSCKSGTGAAFAQIQVIWSSSGTVTLNSSIGNTSKAVTGTSALAGGTISANLTQTVTTNIPGTITCSAASGGDCAPTYTYQWQLSTDNINWTNITGATATSLAFTAAPTQTTYYRRKATESVSGSIAYSNTATVFVTLALTSGSITSSVQSIAYTVIPATIKATAATGGTCSGLYLYQWQFSTNGSVYSNIEGATADSLLFYETLDSNTYFRRKVVCGTDSVYTPAQMITVSREFNPGSITSSIQNIAINTMPQTINATPALYGSCGTYVYQWQQSFDGLTFTNIAGATAQNLTFSAAISTSTFYRRKGTCTADIGYTNVIAVIIKPAVIAPTVPKNAIDTLLESVGVNIGTLFNLVKDSTANNRNNDDSTLVNAFSNDEYAQQLAVLQLSPSTLSQADLDSLMVGPFEDSIATRLAKSSLGGIGIDSMPALAPFLDDNIIQLYRSTSNYTGLDSLVNLEPSVPAEAAFAKLIDSLNGSGSGMMAMAQGSNPNPPAIWLNSVVINGPNLVTRNQNLPYTATFNFPLGASPDIRWIVSGGIITAKNVNPANGFIYANVTWQSSFGIPFVAVMDLVSGQYAILPIKFNGPWFFCRAFPVTQTVYFNQAPGTLYAVACYESTGASSTYQWQRLDVYSNTNWTDIAGATTASYQPPSLSNAWTLYRRITKVYNGVGTLLGTYPSSAVSVKLKVLDPGQISASTLNVPKNTIPVVTATTPSGGYTAAGSTLGYTWEYSTNGGTSWTSIGTAANFPSYQITVNAKFRRTVKINGLTATNYTLPQNFWQASTNILDLNAYYQTVDYENRNYIRENVVLTRGLQTWETVDGLAIEKKIQTTTYLDGLSRPEQVVAKGAHYDETANQWYDLVQPITYEAGGRVDKSLLPYPSTENIGKFKNNVATDQPAYFSAKFGETNAFGRADYDGSPLNRVLTGYGPGISWSGSNVGVNGDLEPYSQTEDVKWLTIGYNSTDLPMLQGVYANLFLMKSYGKDEKLKKVITYTNRTGQVILKKVQLAETGAGLTAQHGGWLCTYYVYNDHGQLRYTITPKGVKELEANGWVMNQTIADELCFWYDYDELGRTVAKKTPGKGVEYIVYDKRNRPVFSQDANQRAKSPDEWLTVLYDDLNRPVLSGIYKSDNTRDQLALAAATPNTLTTIATTNGGSINVWGSPLTATNVNTATIFTQLTFTYYDKYGFSGAKTFNSTHTQNLVYKNAGASGDIEQPTLTARINGMATGSKTLVLDGNATPKYLGSTLFYDEEGRAIQVQSDNIKTGVDIASTQYHFDGRVLSKSETQNAIGTSFTNFNILTKYKFDKIGRVVGLGKKINSAARTYITSPNVGTAQEDDDAGYKITAAYKFNELGKLAKKTLSPTGGTGGTPLETIDYSYNIRGWLTGINKDYALGEYTSNQWDHYFGMYIGYDNRDGKFSAAQLNGQITGVQWKSQGDNTPRRFDYTYDNANRLTAANFLQKGTSAEAWNASKMDFSTKGMSYDENGNLSTLTQMGIIPGIASPLSLDILSYNYVTKTNRLSRIDDTGTAGVNNGKQGDFKDGTNAAGSVDYSFDANGNLTLDNNKRVTAVAYNYLDKPELITIAAPPASTGGGTIQYIYSAGGNKLQKVVTENPSPTNGNQLRVITTSYIGAYVYEKTVVGANTSEILTMIGHEEGRIRVITPYYNASDPSNFIGGGVVLPDSRQGVYDYFITDNLGSVRATITEEINKASSVCTMEDANTTIKQYEESLFGNTTNNEVVGTRINTPNTLWTTNTSLRVSKLQSPDGTATKMGPNALLRVMAGDLINAKADYYYQLNPGSNATASTSLTAMLQSVLAAFSGGKATSLFKDQASSINSALSGTSALQTLMNSQPTSGTTTAPRAYLTYLFFDEQFNYVSTGSGFLRVSQAGDGNYNLTVTGLKAPKNGYAYIYLSNGSLEPVYFDNFTVSQEKGRLIEENHYYAHGLKIASISSKSLSSSLNPKMVNYGFQGAFAEEVNEFDLNYNEFDLRTYDPQIGRWTTPDPYDEFASPYLGMGSDPTNNVDPSGGSIGSAIMSFFGTGAGGSANSFVSKVLCPGETTLKSIGTVAQISASFFVLGADQMVSELNSQMGKRLNPIGENQTNSNIEHTKEDQENNSNTTEASSLSIQETLILQLNGSLMYQSPIPRVFVFAIFEEFHPEAYKHVKDAISNGYPDLLTYDGNTRDAELRHKLAMSESGLSPIFNQDRDIYPFKCTFESGILNIRTMKHASVSYMSQFDNRSVGGLFGVMVTTLNIQKGDKIKVLLIPKKGWRFAPQVSPKDNPFPPIYIPPIFPALKKGLQRIPRLVPVFGRALSFFPLIIPELYPDFQTPEKIKL